MNWKALYALLCMLSLSIAAKAEEAVLGQLKENEANTVNLGLITQSNEPVIFHGTVSFDNAGGPNHQILYTAPNVAGLLVEMVAHGFIVDSVKKNQKDQLQKDADNVLSPYQQILSKFMLKDLMQRSLNKLSTPGNKAVLDPMESINANWLVKSRPMFSLSQDQRAVIINSDFTIYKPTSPSIPLYQGTVKVVSKAKNEKDLFGFWSANEGEQLKEESADLFAKSLDIALSHGNGNYQDSNSVFKTLRYREGGVEKIERGQILSDNCDHTIIKTLRGSLLSVPGHCETPH